MASLISIIALIVSVTSILISGYFASRAKKDRETQMELELFSEIREYRHAVRVWGFEAIDAISAALFLCKPQAVTKEQLIVRHNEILFRLSSVTDKGRLFIPNVHPDAYGTNKPLAYQGFREPILNIIISVYDSLCDEFDFGEKNNGRLFKRLWVSRKKFVSELQEIVDPRELERKITELGQKVPTD